MKSFHELYSAYYQDIFRFLHKLCGYHGETAEELTQETFYHAYLGITKFRGDCDVKTWLLQIAKNQYFTFLRKEKGKLRELSLSELVIEITDPTAKLPADILYEKKLIADSLDIVFSLPEHQKMVFIDRIYYQMPYTEIAEEISISESSAKVLFHRTKLLLRKRLKEEHGYEI